MGLAWVKLEVKKVFFVVSHLLAASDHVEIVQQLDNKAYNLYFGSGTADILRKYQGIKDFRASFFFFKLPPKLAPAPEWTSQLQYSLSE